MNEHVIINIPEERTIAMVTVEIKTLQKQAQQVVLGYAIEIGRRLTEAKAMLPHGAWGDWLRDEVEYSKSTANNFMRIFDAYGSNQMSLFGPEAKSQALGNLPFTKALRLLAIPEDEREEFVVANNVEDLSTRELDRLIKERDAAKTAQAEAEARAERAEKQAAEAPALLESQQKALSDLEAKLQEAQKQAAEQTAKVDAATAKAKKAQADAKAAMEKLKQLRENPEIPEGTMAKIRSEAKTAAENAAAEKLAAKVREAKEKQEEAERAAKNAQEDLERAQREKEALEKKLALANEDSILFKAEFERLQSCFNRCHGMIMKIEANNPDIVPNLKNAMRAVLNSMKERV